MPLARTSRPVLPAINPHEPCRRATGAVAPAASVAHGLHHAKIMLLALTAKQLAVFVPRRLPKGRGRAVRECPGFDETALPIQHADDMQHAVELARAAAKPGDIIILSPASASFDLYPNFEVRGREFKKIVNALK